MKTKNFRKSRAGREDVTIVIYGREHPSVWFRTCHDRDGCSWSWSRSWGMISRSWYQPVSKPGFITLSSLTELCSWRTTHDRDMLYHGREEAFPCFPRKIKFARNSFKTYIYKTCLTNTFVPNINLNFKGFKTNFKYIYCFQNFFTYNSNSIHLHIPLIYH